MASFPIPVNEAQRLAALYNYAILDTPPEAAFDRLTRMAAQMFDMPVAAISLVDTARQWFKSGYGLTITQTDRSVAFCAHTIAQAEPMVVCDTTNDARFSGNPLVTGDTGFRFYAGAPLRTKDNLNMGSLCIIDTQPHPPLTALQLQALTDLAALTVEELERRRYVARVFELELALRVSEERLQSFLDHAPAVAFVKDAQGRYRYVNKAFLQVFGGIGEQYLGKSDHEVFPAELASVFQDSDREAFASGATGPLLGSMLKQDATEQHWIAEKFVFHDGGGNRLLGGIGVDATALEETKRALRISEERWQLAMQGTDQGLFDYDLTTARVFYSTHWTAMLGYSPDELGDSPEIGWSLVHPDDLPGAQENLRLYLNRIQARYSDEFRMRSKDGRWRWILAHAQAVWDVDGRPTRLVGTHTDITARRQAEDRMAEEALTDSLTGLANRRRLERELAAAIGDAERTGSALTVVLADLDAFKLINDTYGHESGDYVLIEFARLLQQSVRHSDIAARLGGDEFCLILRNATAEQAGACVQRIVDRLAAIRFNVARASGSFSINATFGFASWIPGYDGRLLLTHADDALYRQKLRQINHACILDSRNTISNLATSA